MANPMRHPVMAKLFEAPVAIMNRSRKLGIHLQWRNVLTLIHQVLIDLIRENDAVVCQDRPEELLYFLAAVDRSAWDWSAC